MAICLRDYQINMVNIALQKIRAGKVAYLAAECRCGKTLTALAIADKHHLGADANVLFLTKKKAISSIVDDYNAGGFKYKLTVTNFEQAGKLIACFNFVIIDEAHAVGGAYPKPSKRFLDIKRLTKGVHVLFLSATPCPESFSQIFHQLQLSDNSPFKQFKTFYQWFKEYGIPGKIKINATQEVNDYTHTKPELQDVLAEVFITMTRKEAGFKQEIKEIFHRIEMKPQTINLFRTIRIDRICYPNLNNVVTADTGGKLLQKCHQIASGTVIDDEGFQTVVDDTKANYLFSAFKERKFAIFYVFKAELELITKHAKNAGKTLTNDPDEFNSTGIDCVYVGQVVSSREGVNLKSADLIVMFNIHCAAVSYYQSIARLQTKDRETSAQIHWLFSNTGLEEKIYKMVQNKKKYTEKVFQKDFLNLSGRL